ncbi:hypothetical protein M427DRAFT_108245 [Gonapodya prolifera JEL478]|uniref:NF-X1-type domain-containing protein n=1 Tax=Gonapodya prolifera (strain JEL478) TaxID=1344416 RepID=A0A139ATJ1_GONPJ|nr:hypothetical protein M427DRAFT_108245 [Gonapodya prolifera JEL478]|eukprot:KXS20046.1 hypothetical protein M427DRAFT_108245 [Gonapodya prolifera JEL478]
MGSTFDFNESTLAESRADGYPSASAPRRQQRGRGSAYRGSGTRGGRGAAYASGQNTLYTSDSAITGYATAIYAESRLGASPIPSEPSSSEGGNRRGGRGRGGRGGVPGSTGGRRGGDAGSPHVRYSQGRQHQHDVTSNEHDRTSNRGGGNDGRSQQASKRVPSWRAGPASPPNSVELNSATAPVSHVDQPLVNETSRQQHGYSGRGQRQSNRGGQRPISSKPLDPGATAFVPQGTQSGEIRVDNTYLQRYSGQDDAPQAPVRESAGYQSAPRRSHDARARLEAAAGSMGASQQRVEGDHRNGRGARSGSRGGPVTRTVRSTQDARVSEIAEASREQNGYADNRNNRTRERTDSAEAPSRSVGTAKMVQETKTDITTNNGAQIRHNENGNTHKHEHPAVGNENQQSGHQYSGKTVSSKPDSDDLLSNLVHGLTTLTYDCLICTDRIRHHERTWSCSTCWAVFHLHCTQKWGTKAATVPQNPTIASASAPAGSGPAPATVRCPQCSTAQPYPTEYRCFCGGAVNPKYNSYLTPHSCGEPCLGIRPGGLCPHECVETCHPGPHPPCTKIVEASCFCGKTKFAGRCNDPETLKTGSRQRSCGDICGKTLACGIHQCENLCHHGACEPCTIPFERACYCGNNVRSGLCGSSDDDDTQNGFSCGEPCPFKYSCNVHGCDRTCHGDVHDPAETCPLDPSKVTNCPCGRAKVVILLKGKNRERCVDPIPTCPLQCGKTLKCGHKCLVKCHAGSCPPCANKVKVKCRCKSMEQEMLCGNLELRADGKSYSIEHPKCFKVCKALRSCGKHQCGIKCCPLNTGQAVTDDPEGNHVCKLLCGKSLPCGHPCEERCHKGRCPPCLNAIFTELSCHCGQTVLFPPQPCGTKPPVCRRPCIRRQMCGHDMISHECHQDDVACPPCSVLVERVCGCGRKVLKLPCFRSDRGPISCGLKCEETLECGHSCPIVCHDHGTQVVQALTEIRLHPESATWLCAERCVTPRRTCGHPCGALCHGVGGLECPDTACKHPVTLTCKCGNRTQAGVCSASQANAAAPASEEESLEKTDEKVDGKPGWRQFLQCDSTCAISERNKKLAVALDIDLAARGSTPAVIQKYPPSILEYASKNLAFVRSIEKTFADFIDDASKTSTHVLRNARRSHLEFAEKLAARAYDLSPEVLDVDTSTPSLIVRRKKTSKIPTPLLSDAATPQASGSAVTTTAPRSKSKTTGKGLSAVNALHLVGVAFGIDGRDLEILLEPLFGTSNKISISWVGEDDAVVMMSGRTSKDSMGELEDLLRRIQPAVAEKFLANGWASSVQCVWMNARGEIVGEAKPKVEEKNIPVGSAAGLLAGGPPAPVRTPSPNHNAFDVFNDLGTALGSDPGWKVVSQKKKKREIANQSQSEGDSETEVRETTPLENGAHVPEVLVQDPSVADAAFGDENGGGEGNSTESKVLGTTTVDDWEQLI